MAERLGISRLSADQVSAIRRSLDGEVSALAGRAFEDLESPYPFLDATYARRCRDLGKRGVSGVRCVTGDAHGGLGRAIAECLPGAAWQRRAVHPERSACSLPKTRRRRAMAGKAMRAVFREDGPAVARCAYQAAADAVGAMPGEAGDLLEEAEADALAYLGFPAEHRRRIRTNDCRGRTNRETRRRSRVVQAFPGAGSMVRLVGVVMAEQDEDWSGRRWVVPESLARLEGPAPAGQEASDESRERGLKVVQTAMGLADAGRRVA